MEEEEDAEEGVVVEEKRPDVDEPSKFAVVLHNDDYTTMEFVIEVLVQFFQKNQQEASQVMLKVHQHGSGLAGIYSFEIAETKVAQVLQHAKTKGFPLRCTVEPLGGG